MSILIVHRTHIVSVLFFAEELDTEYVSLSEMIVMNPFLGPLSAVAVGSGM